MDPPPLHELTGAFTYAFFLFIRKQKWKQKWQNNIIRNKKKFSSLYKILLLETKPCAEITCDVSFSLVDYEIKSAGLACRKIFLYIYLFIYLFWLCWVFFAACGLSLVASGGYSSLQCTGFSVRWLLLLQSTGSSYAGFRSCGAWGQ